jgi:hypothetical protein
MADPAQCRRHAQKCVNFARRARSTREKRALLRLARTWSSLASQTEAYEAIVCELVDRSGHGFDQSSALLGRTALRPVRNQ